MWSSQGAVQSQAGPGAGAAEYRGVDSSSAARTQAPSQGSRQSSMLGGAGAKGSSGHAAMAAGYGGAQMSGMQPAAEMYEPECAGGCFQ